jgi:hypothetical protein
MDSYSRMLFIYVVLKNHLARSVPEHAAASCNSGVGLTTETSLILALNPEIVSPGYTSAVPLAGASIEELEKIASVKEWPGYFGSPALASASLGRETYEQWVARENELVATILAGGNYRKLPRFGDVYSDNPADAAAMDVSQHLDCNTRRGLENCLLYLMTTIRFECETGLRAKLVNELVDGMTIP